MYNQKMPFSLSKLFAYEGSLFESFFSSDLLPWEIWDYAIKHFLQDKKSCNETYPSVYFKNKESIIIQEGAEIAPGAYIEGPCFIGKKASIGHCAYIRAGTFLAPGVHIGHCSEINRSILLENAKAPHFNYIGDSIIGRDVNLGARVTIANLRLDEKPIHIIINGKKISTGRGKFGALVGDGATIGCGVILNPGTIISKNTEILPLTTQKGFI